MPRKKKAPQTPVEAISHKSAKRTNIPTSELKGFVAEDEAAPKSMLYPRDPTLDPQLVWKGKDAQDRADLEVLSVPIYIQEKIAPKAIIEDFRRVEKDDAEPQAQLFSDFNGIQFEEMIDFYKHSQNWSNRMILGDSLLVMNSLSEKEGLKGKVQMVYMDPPYGIKFGSNWQVSTRKREVKDGKVEDASREPEVVKAFRDTWELRIHSYLSYLRDRLLISRDLLTESGSIFVQIGDENVHLVRALLDEVFGSENFCAEIYFKKTTGSTSGLLSQTRDFILWYAKDRETVKYRPMYVDKKTSDLSTYDTAESFDASVSRKLTSDENNGNLDTTKWRVVSFQNLRSQGFRTNTTCDFKFEGKTYHPGQDHNWKTTVDGLNKLVIAHRIAAKGNTLQYKRYLDDFPVMPITCDWADTAEGFMTDKTYVVQTSEKPIARCMHMTTDPGDLVLDPTCGSGTTAYVAEHWGRRWITIDTSRVALALARTRLMSARFPYYILSDTRDGQLKDAEITGSNAALTQPTEGDIRKGFVCKRVPHVTLKSIANSPDIREGMSREEIDAAIALHADQEILFDQPFEDKRRVRVAGSFTVESLSPHRVLSALEEESKEDTALETETGNSFVSIILENLKKAGVQNTQKGERLVFEELNTTS